MAKLGDETLAEHAWRVLGQACDERLAVGKAAEGLELPFPIVDDGFAVHAPLAGLVAGLRAATYDVAVFLPVDTPLVGPALLRALGEACRDAAVPRTGPLPGAYARRALPILERRLDGGDLALRQALTELETVVVNADPAQLVNVNTPGDLAALAKATAAR